VKKKEDKKSHKSTRQVPLLNNKNKGGTGIDSLLGLASGINQEKLAAVGEMGKKPREAQIEAQEMERCGPTRRIHLG